MECLVHYMSNSMIFEYVVPIEFESFLSNSDQLLVYAKLIENAVNPIKKFPFSSIPQIEADVNYVPAIVPNETLCF